MTMPLTPEQEALALQQQAQAQGLVIPGMAGGPPAAPPPPPPAAAPPVVDDREARLAAQNEASAMAANAAGKPYKVGDLPVNAAELAAAPQQQAATQMPQGHGPAGPQPGIAGNAFMTGGGYRPAGEVRNVGDRTIMAFAESQDEKSKAAASQESRALGQAMRSTVARDEAVGTQEKIATGAEAEIEALAKKRAEQEAKLARIEEEGTRLSSTQIDPDRFWNSKSTGAQIAYGIMSFLADIGTGLVGGENPHRASLNKAIERDVDAQVRAYQAKEKNIEARRSLVGQLMRDTGGDLQQTKAILRDAQTKKAMAMADWAAASAKTDDAYAKADALKIALAEDRANWMAKAFPYQQAQASGGKQLVPVRASNGAIVYVSPEKALEYDQSQQKIAIDQQKAQAEAGKSVQADAKWLAERRAAQGLPEMETMLSAAKQSQATAGTKGIGPGATRLAEQSPLIYGAIYGKDAAKREQDWSALKNLYYNKLSGAAVGVKEEDRLRRQLDSARTPEDRTNALIAIDNASKAAAANLERAAPQAAQILRGNSAPLPASVRRDK